MSDALAGPSTRDTSTDASDAVRVARASDASMSRIDKTSNKKRKSDVTSRPRVLGSTQAASSGVGQAVDDSRVLSAAQDEDSRTDVVSLGTFEAADVDMVASPATRTTTQVKRSTAIVDHAVQATDESENDRRDTRKSRKRSRSYSRSSSSSRSSSTSSTARSSSSTRRSRSSSKSTSATESSISSSDSSDGGRRKKKGKKRSWRGHSPNPKRQATATVAVPAVTYVTMSETPPSTTEKAMSRRTFRTPMCTCRNIRTCATYGRLHCCRLD